MKYRFIGRRTVTIDLKALGKQQREVLRFEMIDPDEVL